MHYDNILRLFRGNELVLENVLKEVKSPFTNGLIQKLIVMYIACGCDNGKLYRAINNSGMSNNVDNSHTRELITYLLSGGEREDDLSFERYALPYACEKKDRWIIMFSDQDPMAERTKNFDAPKPLIYRIYLNLKGKEKQDFILRYMNRCRADNVPYKFKFCRDDSRNDQIILLSRAENLAQNLSIVENITESMHLGMLPMLVGEYKDGIGVAEEYYNRLWGYTDVKLALLRTSVKKYLCDHKDEFYDELSDDERKRLCTYIGEFDFLYNERSEEKERKEKRRI